ncbi:hypothetical protein K503DRAFT_190984 [Rhizopogon vinicolor AM-OR11-026]|uniref:Uncharacterized protein n=1 Tax=Rhizopogon vinicolor AM-OR11-026 TaxID=1314800 RepID=A0A1B7MZG5_9AGAM|nr:hypothetical protein K503DRAFT_190984 [Rhizopogon vinicolor AM-OR11-026]
MMTRYYPRKYGRCRSGTGNTLLRLSVLSGTTVVQDPDDSMDFCFLGNDRLLIASHKLKLYSIEDMSRAPQLLACFLLPVPVAGIQCLLPMDDIAPSSQLRMQAQQEMWASDPANRLLSLVTFPLNLVFVISTRIFFDLPLSEGMEAGIHWKSWGPSNTRIFNHHSRCRIGVSGNRVLQSFPIDDTTEDSARNSSHRLHMMDFSPSAVERRQGLGRMITEPATIEVMSEGEKVTLTTSLPYVEVMSDRKFGVDELIEIWVDKDRIYLPKDTAYPHVFDPSINYLEVSEI